MSLAEAAKAPHEQAAQAPAKAGKAAETSVTEGVTPPELTVVVPLHNEAENIEALLWEIAQVLRPLLAYEVICVDDGSEDETVALLKRLRQNHGELRVLRHRARMGQSAALHSGVAAARAQWIATLDGDGQNDPADIPALLAKREAVQNDDSCLITGVRAKRRDSFAKRLASRFANGLRRLILRDGARDTGCSLKVFTKQTYLALPFFDHMHRFLPALVTARGGRLVEVPVNHRPRQAGRSHYGNLERGLVGVIDLIGVVWLQRRAKNPEVFEESES